MLVTTVNYVYTFFFHIDLVYILVEISNVVNNLNKPGLHKTVK